MMTKLFLPLLLLLGLLASTASAQCSCSNKGGKGHRGGHRGGHRSGRHGGHRYHGNERIHARDVSFNDGTATDEISLHARDVSPTNGTATDEIFLPSIHSPRQENLQEEVHQTGKLSARGGPDPAILLNGGKWPPGYSPLPKVPGLVGLSNEPVHPPHHPRFNEHLSPAEAYDLPRPRVPPSRRSPEGTSDELSGFKTVVRREEDILNSGASDEDTKKVADALKEAFEHIRQIEAQEQAISHLNVTISQVSEHPIILNVEIKNPSDLSINFWDEYSPISPSAFELGFFEIFADGMPLNFGEKTRTRLSKDFKQSVESIDNILHLGPGQALDRDITIPPDSVKDKGHLIDMLKEADKVKIQSTGKWIGVGACASNETVVNREAFADWSEGDHSWKSNFIELDL